VHGLLQAGELRRTPHSVHSRWAKVKYRAVAVKEQGTTLFTELKLKRTKDKRKHRVDKRVCTDHMVHTLPARNQPGVYFLPFFPSLDLVFALTFTAGNTNLGLFLTSKAKNSSADGLLEGGRFSSRIIAS
jgi:hypothetical protein